MQLIDNPEIYRTVLDNVAAGVCVVDRSGKILLWNDGAERLTGFFRQDVVGHSSQEDFLNLVDMENNAIATDAQPLSSALRDGRVSDSQVSLKQKSGQRVVVLLHATPLRDESGSLIGAMESFSEWIPSGSLEARQNKLAAYGCLDPVSGVLNHGMMQSHLRETLATFEEHNVPFSLLCIGVDRLEEIAHRYGSGAVAAVMRSVGQTLETNLRPTDFIGRWMDNEFLVILTECGGDEISLVGERLRKMVLQGRLEWWGDRLQITVSTGGTHVRAGDSVEDILIRAETRLQRSIAKGGNQLTVCDEAGSGDS
jgi:diguanylate cyclase (GGDEF)-like protein/PAS domain S-box-containing protein